MMHEPRPRAAVANLVLACALVGCTGGGTAGDTGPPPLPPAEESTDEAPSGQPDSPQDAAADAAEQAVLDYYRVTDELLVNPQLDIERLVDVATGVELEELSRQVQQARADGRQQVGSAVVASLELTEVGAGPPATAGVQVCLDVAGVDVLDRDGTSVVSADREPRSLVGLTLVETADRGWRVEQTQSEGVACAAP